MFHIAKKALKAMILELAYRSDSETNLERMHEDK